MEYDPKDNIEEQYDDAFKERAAAIAHARSRSLSEVAASLSVPAESLSQWKAEYADRVVVHYIKDRILRNRRGGLPFLSKPAGDAGGAKLERCVKCGADVVFEPVKSFEVQREDGVDLGTRDSIMNSGDDGILGFEVPYVRVTTEIITRCPVCGVYMIGNVTEKLTNSEA